MILILMNSIILINEVIDQIKIQRFKAEIALNNFISHNFIDRVIVYYFDTIRFLSKPRFHFQTFYD